jgi:hypothetical protein
MLKLDAHQPLGPALHPLYAATAVMAPAAAGSHIAEAKVCKAFIEVATQ